jgi:hypothetical protein
VQLIDGLAPWLATAPFPVPAPSTVSIDGPSKVAATVRACDIVTTQSPVPAHAPLQPVNTWFALGVATSVTDVPARYGAAHVPLVAPAVTAQLIAGVAPWLSTLPVPVPPPVTVSVNGLENVAVTVRACDIVTTQLAVPVQAPLHPANTSPPAGVATKVTDVPELYVAAHVPLVAPAVIVQAIAGLAPEVATLPFPPPAPCTVSAYVGTNVAVTVRA